jgi:hypothetical protein
MLTLRELLTEQEQFPSRRTWERRLKAIPESLPAQIGRLGRHLALMIQPWTTFGRAVAIDSTILRARGGVWHQKHREKGNFLIPPLILRRIGPNQVGMDGSMAGNCMSSPSLQVFGSLSLRC